MSVMSQCSGSECRLTRHDGEKRIDQLQIWLREADVDLRVNLGPTTSVNMLVDARRYRRPTISPTCFWAAFVTAGWQ